MERSCRGEGRKVAERGRVQMVTFCSMMKVRSCGCGILASPFTPTFAMVGIWKNLPRYTLIYQKFNDIGGYGPNGPNRCPRLTSY